MNIEWADAIQILPYLSTHTRIIYNLIFSYIFLCGFMIEYYFVMLRIMFSCREAIVSESKYQ